MRPPLVSSRVSVVMEMSPPTAAAANPIVEEMPLGGLGRLLALTPNDEANALAAQHLREVFSSSEVYQVPPQSRSEGSRDSFVSRDLGGRFLFQEGVTLDDLQQKVERGWLVKKTVLTDKFTPEDYEQQYGGEAEPLFVLTEDRKLIPYTHRNAPTPTLGQAIIGLVPPTSSTGA